MTLALLLASTLSITSNTAVVKGWVREHLTFDTSAQEFSREEFPSAAEAEGARLVAESLPGILDAATTSLTNAIAPLMARLDGQRARPVVMLAAAANPDNAVDRRNLTMVAVSNEIARVGSNVTVRAWVYGNSVLASDPVVKLRVATDLGRTVAWTDCAWTHYGDQNYAVDAAVDGETYETYLLTATIPGVPPDMPVRMRPWVKVGDPAKGFDYGNRQLRVNGVTCCTTNSLAFLGRFYTTNNVEITDLVPYADRGELRFAEAEEEEP